MFPHQAAQANRAQQYCDEFEHMLTEDLVKAVQEADVSRGLDDVIDIVTDFGNKAGISCPSTKLQKRLAGVVCILVYNKGNYNIDKMKLMKDIQTRVKYYDKVRRYPLGHLVKIPKNLDQARHVYLYGCADAQPLEKPRVEVLFGCLLDAFMSDGRERRPKGFQMDGSALSNAVVPAGAPATQMQFLQQLQGPMMQFANNLMDRVDQLSLRGGRSSPSADGAIPGFR